MRPGQTLKRMFLFLFFLVAILPVNTEGGKQPFTPLEVWHAAPSTDTCMVLSQAVSKIYS